MLLLVMCLVQIAVLAAILLQDFRHRAITWWLPLLMLGLGFAVSAQYLPVSSLLEMTLYNALLIALVLGLLALYVLVRKGSMTHFFSAFFGLGDVLVLLALCPVFGNINFVMTFTLGNLLILLAELLRRGLFRPADQSIPYAGYVAGLMIPAYMGYLLLPQFELITPYARLINTFAGA